MRKRGWRILARLLLAHDGEQVFLDGFLEDRVGVVSQRLEEGEK